jgi:hypothetical protein
MILPGYNDQNGRALSLRLLTYASLFLLDYHVPRRNFE